MFSSHIVLDVLATNPLLKFFGPTHMYDRHVVNGFASSSVHHYETSDKPSRSALFLLKNKMEQANNFYSIDRFVRNWIDTAIKQVQQELNFLNPFKDWEIIRNRINLKEEYLKQLLIVKSNWENGVYKDSDEFMKAYFSIPGFNRDVWF